MAAANPDHVVEVFAPAKINLFLALRGRRSDGYHDLVSVLQTVSVRDRLSAELNCPPGRVHHPAARRSMVLRLEIDGTPGVPPGQENLVLQAALALGERLDLVDTEHHHAPRGDNWAPVTVLRLHKRIPVAGGMAGGSTDAAATLVALNALWDGRLSRDELQEMAAHLGSDVPFCVMGGTAIATGRGTRLARVLCRGTFHWVIGISDEPLSTAAVYREWDAQPEPSLMEPDVVLAALSTGDAEALGGALANDLQEAVFRLRPEIAERRAALLQAGALGAVVSGSGPTVLGLAADAAAAQRIARDVAGEFDRVEVAVSPAGGPEVAR